MSAIAVQNLGVTASRRQKCAQVIVLSGIRLLNSITWLVGQWRSALFHSAKAVTPPATMQ